MVIARNGRRTMSSNEAKQKWGTVVQAVENGERVIVESHGRPKLAVISVEDLERFEARDEADRRERALTAIREIEARYDGRNDDLTEDEIEEIAVRAGRELMRDLAEAHRVRFERLEK